MDVLIKKISYQKYHITYNQLPNLKNPEKP